MSFDPSTFVGVSRPWLTTQLTYEGMARAEFSIPPCAIEGPATIRIGSDGRCRVHIKVENREAFGGAPFSLGSGSAPMADFLVDGMHNPCRSLTVRTESGVFTAGDRVLHDGTSLSKQDDVFLRPLQARFEATVTAPAKYWVLPLANFMPRPWNGRYYPQLADHPLRLASWPTIPDGLSERDQLRASYRLHHHGSLYTFLLNGETGFIERMPDYGRRLKRIQKKRSRMITAAMVGPAHLQNVEWSDYASLFPIDILNWLTLATGVAVGAPWIEFRDENGALVRRVHISFGAGRYQRSTAALHPQLIGNGSGYLIGKVLTAADRGEKYLRVATTHALSASKHNATLENRFISICRGFETLCRHHGFIRQDLSRRLKPNEQVQLSAILKEAAAKVRAMQQAAADPYDRSVLETIGARTLNASQTEKSFGLAVADLAQKFGFHDAEVLDAYLSAHPHFTGKTWPGVLTFYRGAATHDAYFDFASRNEVYTLIRVMNHLNDLLLRVLFKTVGYDGPYQSPIPPLMQRDSIDWVTPVTPAALLGYG